MRSVKVFLCRGSHRSYSVLTVMTEAIAETTSKPLLLFPTGELGGDLRSIQSELRRLVRYGTAWKAILLIDEADVFLESRQVDGHVSLERNALVAGKQRLFPKIAWVKHP